MTDRARAELPGNTEVLVRWGAWLFRYRSYVLLPLAAFLALEAGLLPPRIGGASLEVARAGGLGLDRERCV